jgi:four helix bundle protein
VDIIFEIVIENYYFYLSAISFINNLNRCIMGDFRKLRVWQKAKELAVKIYQLVKKQTISKDYGYKDQIQRAAISIPANIAEGDELGTDKQSVRHFFIAKGSCAELHTLIIIGSEIGYIDNDIANILINDCKIISVMLAKIIHARS